MTEKKYYHDSYCIEFLARVQSTVTFQSRPAVVLDHTYFYPTSGGQEHDTGTIGASRVIDVVESVDETIYHILDQHLNVPAGKELQAKVDWHRRFEHMQQHTGQHLLSAAFEHLFAIPTHSSRLGKDVATLDLKCDKLTPEMVQEAEVLTNEIVWQNRPTALHYLDPEACQDFGLRSIPKVSGIVRVLEIPEFDRTPCGGTHVGRTGEIGMVAITHLEKLKNGIYRVEFHCGSRALRDYRKKNEVIQKSVQKLSVPEASILQKLDALLLEAKEKDKRLSQRDSEVYRLEANALAMQFAQTPAPRFFRNVYVNETPERLSHYAERLRKIPSTLVILINKTTDKVQCWVARSEDMTVDARSIVKSLLAVSENGKGGGRSEFAQGGGPSLVTEDALRQLVETYVNLLDGMSNDRLETHRET